MLFRLLGLGLLLRFGCPTAAAQNSYDLADATFKQKLRSQYLQNDTAQALINLYGRRQGGGASWLSGGLLGAAQGLISGGTTTTVNGMVIDQQGPNVGAILLATTPILGYGISKLVRFSNSNLEKTLAGYAAGQPLPAGVRRRLKPRFFNLPIIQYKTVPVVPAN